MQAQIFRRAMLFQQHTAGVTHFPFIRGAPCIAASGKRPLHSLNERRVDIRLNGKVLPIDDEDQPDLLVFFCHVEPFLIAMLI